MADLDLKIRKARKKTLGTRIIKSHTLTLKSMSQLQGNKTKLRERERERERGEEYKMKLKSKEFFYIRIVLEVCK